MRNDEWIIEQLEFLLQDFKATRQELESINFDFKDGLKKISLQMDETTKSIQEMNAIIHNTHQQVLKSLNG